MRIALDISPLESGHSVRGVGFYLQNLKTALEKYDKKNQFTFFNDYINLKTAVDLIHFPYFDPFFLNLPLRKKYKTIITIHDMIPLVYPEHFPPGLKGKFKFQINKRIASRAEAIITDSNASKKDIISHLGISPDRIHVVYLAAGEEFRKQPEGLWKKKLKDKYHLPKKFALYVGDVTWNKNLIRLIAALKKVNLPLIMVGKAFANTDYDKTNPWNADLNKLQEQIKNDPLFTVPGFIPTSDLSGLYNLATVLVTPSLYEGFGLPILEAMQSGCPVITTENGSLKEVAGEAAYFVDPNDTDSIAIGLRTVWKDEKLRQNLARKGLEQAKKFTWEKTARETVKVYEKVFNSNH